MPDTQRIEDIVQSIRSKSSFQPEGVSNSPANLLRSQKNNFQTGIKPIQRNTIEDIEYVVPKSAIFDRLSNGAYVAKYENYKTAFGNEERLAQQQGTGEKMLHGVEKFVGKTVTNFLDSTVGTATGLVNWAKTGDFSGLWDNEFSNTMDDWNKQMNYALPNYYTNEEKSMNFLQKMGTANFWFNEVGEGLAFVAGALLPSIALAPLTAGSSLGVGLGKLGISSASKLAKKAGLEAAELAAKRGAKEFAEDTLIGGARSSLNKVNDAIGYNQGRDLIRGWNRAIYGKTAGDVVSTAGFLFRTSNFEAGMEARHGFHDAVEQYYDKFEQENGRMPTMQEAAEFTSTAKTAANYLYGANLAILGVSNAAMFGEAFGFKVPKISNTKIGNFANRAIGLGTKTLDDGTMVMRGANKLQKGVGTAYKILEKPAIEGLYEEGFQGVAGKTMEKYLDGKYDPNNTSAHSLWANLADSFSEQYGTKEGWNEIGIGMIIGLGGGLFTPRGTDSEGGVNEDGTPKKASFSSKFSGFGENSRKGRYAAIERDVNKVNKGIEVLRGMDRASSARNFRNLANSKAENFESNALENAAANVEFIRSQEHIKSPREIQKDFDTVIDNMTLNEEMMNSLDEAGADLDTYKASLKSEFKQNLEDYNFAKKAVQAVGLDRSIKETPGNISNMHDAMLMNIMMGKSSLKAAQNVAGQIEALIKPGVYNEAGQAVSGGVFDHLQFYNNLTEDKKKAVKELRIKQKNLKTLQDKAVQLQQEVALTQEKRKGNKTDKSLENKYNSTAQKAVLATQQITKLQSEVDSLVKSLDSSFDAATFDLDGTASAQPQNILTTLEELDKLDNYIDALRENGKDYEANSIEYLMDQFKGFSDAHREMMEGHRRMLDTGFFTSEKGQKLIDKLVGKKYKMSDEFKQILKDNDEVIDRSLRLANYRGSDSANVQDIIRKAIEENPDLSEREKFRLEAMIRLHLNMNLAKDAIENIVEISTDFNAEKEQPLNPLEGDTVRIKQTLDIKNRDLNNVKQLDEIIGKILAELDFIKKDSSGNESKIAELEQRIQDLQKQKENLKNKKDANEKSNQEKSTIDNGSEDQGVDSRQQENREIPGLERNTETDEADNSDSGITSEVLDQEIKKIQEEIIDLSKVTKTIDSPQYKRLLELMALDEADEISTDEYKELQSLQEDLNEWLLISGTVIEGVRLSDLIRQKIILENTPIMKLEGTREVTTKEVMEQVDFEDKQGSVNYGYGQTYDGVMAWTDSVTKDGKPAEVVRIAGIKVNEKNKIEGQFLEDVGIDFEYTVDEETKNIIISKEEVERINAESPIKILPRNVNLSTTSSAVIKFDPNMQGDLVGEVYTNSYLDFTDKMEPRELYELEAGDTLGMEVDALDAHNAKLLIDYRKALRNKKATPESIEKAKEKVRKGLVIRVNTVSGKFVAVLKAKRDNATKTEEALKFEALRDNITDTFLEAIGDTPLANLEKHIVSEPISVDVVRLGHPNIFYLDEGDGKVAIQHRSLTEEDINKIEDIGFVENGEYETKSGAKGLDTTFMANAMKNAGKEKVPFVVFRQGKKRVAYPVKLVERQRPDNSELETVFDNKNLAVTDKVAKLNKLLADRGIDIKISGNAFIAFGKSNLTREFLNEKLAQLEKIQYFRPLNEWKERSTDMKEVLRNDVMINLNLSEPLHSPKLKIDFTEAFKGITIDPASIQKKAKANTAKSTKTSATLENIKCPK